MKRLLCVLSIFLIFFTCGCSGSLYDYLNETTEKASDKDYSELEQQNADYYREIQRLQTQLDALKDTNITYADVMESINNTSLEYIKSNVKIVTTGYKIVSWGRQDITGGQGSGVIFSHNSDSNVYYCLTNNHVTYIEPGYSYVTYKITDYMDNSYSGKLLFSSADYDLAVLQFTANNKVDLKALKIQTKNPEINDLVIAIGQPSGQNNTITIGKVINYEKITLDSSKNESNVCFDVINHTAPINHGSSGGVLINLNGEIVGINYAGSSDENGNSIENFAIPIEKVIEYLTANGFSLK